MAGSTSNPLIGGFIIQGDKPVQVVVRATGPSLADFGVPNPISGTTLAVYSGMTQIASNSGWQRAIAGSAPAATIKSLAAAAASGRPNTGAAR